VRPGAAPARLCIPVASVTASQRRSTAPLLGAPRRVARSVTTLSAKPLPVALVDEGGARLLLAARAPPIVFSDEAWRLVTSWSAL
jgi:hypothetical protein